jgi:branched-subunit amino acid aminotransferase/4-amino-4-deoxychorismate lyase
VPGVLGVPGWDGGAVKTSGLVMELNGVPADVNQITALALMNYGHYTSMRVDDLRVRGLSLHLDRLVRDCRRVFDADLDPNQIRRLVRHALARAPRSVVVRVTVFDPHLELGHPGANAEPHVLVTIRPPTLRPYRPLRFQSAVYRRELPAIKHVGLFGALWRRRIAQRNGFDDVLFTDADSTISEAATSNIGLLDGEEIVWPQAPCLEGTTKRLINQILDGRTTTRPVTLSQLVEADAVFATNAAVGVRPIGAVDGFRWPGPHPTLNALSMHYAGISPEQV